MGFFFAIRGGSPMERVIRTIAMVLVVLTVIWAFWKNNENVIERLQEGQTFWDETGTASPQLKGFTRDFAESLEREYGIRARVQVRLHTITPPDLEEGELYLGIAPAERQAVLRMNPLGETGEALVSAMENEHFEQYWNSDWQAGLESALVVIWSHFSGESEGFMDRVASTTAIEDRTGTLTQEDLDFLARFSAGLQEDFGQKAIIRIFEGPVIVPALDSRTLFIGLSPAAGEALVSFPPLVQRALPAGFADELTQQHFPQAFAAGDWPQGLKEALVRIWRGLAGENMEQ